jgi:hypothetical protein
MSPVHVALVAILGLVPLCVSPAAAAAPAPQLQGKSVVVSWVEARVQRRVGEAEFRPVTRYGELKVYVSTAGRVFHRLSMESRREAGSNERVGDTPNRKFSFEGNTMVAVQTGATGGARRVLVTFTPDFASCSAEVIRGKEEGAASMTANSVIRPGTQVEIKSVTTGGVTCSVKAGNVFGGE